MKKLQTLLKVSRPHKLVNIGGVDVEIPKVGLRHLATLKAVKASNLQEKFEEYIRMFKNDCSWAEAEFILFHVEHYNRKLENTIVVNNEVFDVDNVFISARTEFETCKGTFKFRAPRCFEEFSGPYDVLASTILEAPYEIDDWANEPAYVLSWANDILKTVTLIGSKGTTYTDGAVITGLFINESKQR